MHEKLDFIVVRLVVCAHARDWYYLTTWYSLLQWSVAPATVRVLCARH